MIYALDGLENGKRIEAMSKITAYCPICQEKCISKCGKIKIWHFAHYSKNVCDDLAEN